MSLARRPLVSVLMPYRNAAGTVVAAAESILGQRQIDLELIAIDDGSNDDGPARLAGLAAELGGRPAGLGGRAAPRSPWPGSRLHLVRSAGRGIVAALATGLGTAKASRIARMDADDLAHPDRLRRQVALLDAQPGLGAVGTRVAPFPEGAAGPGLVRYVEWQNGLLSPDDHRRELFVEAPLCHPSVLLRRRALVEVGAYREGPWPEDYDLWLRLDAAGWGLAKVPEVLLLWRHRPGRLTFSDPRYRRDRFAAAKAPFLARRLHRLGRPVAIWGAGPTGKRLGRALEPEGIRAACYIDVDPGKVGRQARGVRIVGLDAVKRHAHTVVVAVGARGARQQIRAFLDHRGFVEGEDYLCAA